MHVTLWHSLGQIVSLKVSKQQQHPYALLLFMGQSQIPFHLCHQVHRLAMITTAESMGAFSFRPLPFHSCLSKRTRMAIRCLFSSSYLLFKPVCVHSHTHCWLTLGNDTVLAQQAVLERRQMEILSLSSVLTDAPVHLPWSLAGGRTREDIQYRSVARFLAIQANF